ncbi:MAG: transglutaminase domain-containing protein, partial [Nitrospirota bacterium]
MRYSYSLFFRVISFIVLFFFSWTFGGMFDIAYAVKASDQKSAVSGQRNQKEKRPEEKFQKSIEDIEEILADTVADTDTKKNKLKAKKDEIESLDVEIKKQFSATEEKIKDLPEEIKQRHRDFVKKYEDNLKEFKTNLDAIDKAKTVQEKEASFKKAKEFLEKVKSTKKHQPLDPNKLPHRTPEVEQTEPRTTPEEFQKDSSQNSVVSIQGKTITQKPILLASNGSLDGLLTGDSNYSPASVIPANVGIQSIEEFGHDSYESQPLLLAQATNPPTSADLDQTIEVQFTPEITAKAQELQNDPVKIYNWVRNNIEFVPTYGSIQGANMCLQTKLCNAFDTASLLIALLRASNIPAKYVYGTIEIPIEKVMNWAGGFTNKMTALSLLASAGIPTKGMLVGGEVKYVRMEHIWVDAWIDYIPSRGARHTQGDTWIPLDASFKQYNYTQGIDIKTAVPFDA